MGIQNIPEHELARLREKAKEITGSQFDYQSSYTDLLSRRLNGEPLQYIEEYVPFYSIQINVDQRCLIPRPETEYMIEIIKRGLFEKHIYGIYQELGHIFITKISQNIYILNLIYSILFLLPLFYFCSTLKRRYFSLLIAYPYYIVVIGMGPIRQAACISFLMLSILLVSKKKYFLSFFISIFSFLIHQFSILFNGLIFCSSFTNIKKIKLTRKIIFLLIIFFPNLIYKYFLNFENLIDL